MKNDELKTIYLPKKLGDLVVKKAQEAGMSVPDYIHQALEKYYADDDKYTTAPPF